MASSSQKSLSFVHSIRPAALWCCVLLLLLMLTASTPNAAVLADDSILATLQAAGYTSFASAFREFPDLLAIVNATTPPTILPTVFALSNDAITRAAIPAESLHSVLSYHIAAGPYPNASLSNGMLLSSHLVSPQLGYLAQKLHVTGDASTKFYVQGVEIGNQTQQSTGVIHQAISVITPPPTLTSVPITPPLTTLTYARTESGMESEFARDALTFLAPSDAAFQQSFSIPVSEYLLYTAQGRSDLVLLLRYHIIQSGLIYTTILNNGTTVLATEATDLSITLNKSVSADGTVDVTVNGAAVVTQADVIGSNGVLHVIDRVLIPPTFYYTIYKDLFGLGLTSFANVIDTAAEFRNLLKNVSGSYTLFAPDNQAFKKAKDNTAAVQRSNSDSHGKSNEQLVAFLGNHLVKGSVPQLTPGLRLNTLSGHVLVVNDDASRVDVEGTSFSAEVARSPSDPVNGAVYVLTDLLGELPSDDGGDGDEEDDDSLIAITTTWQITLGASCVVGAIFVVGGGGWYLKQYLDSRNNPVVYDAVVEI
eukprot:TRINITY_DN2199_c2_g1_i1.p1 TRINITY_DN2199_c2_g1~~TRINITY_DN2199_c2_g1_i1.p1  ORF type:complete len:536 (+),score=91.60 TRINITY_DN2199_c2_g1_i1:66-1673(+)